MSLWRPDPTFYPSPKLAMQAPPEKLAYVAMLNANGNHRPDALGVVDVDPQSNAYGRLVGQLDMPNVGDELHHFGWNACSASLCPYAPHPHIERRYLIVPGINSSRIHIVDTKPDPKKPQIVKVIEPETLAARTGYASPHTIHCGPEGIYTSALGATNGDGPGGIFMMDHDSFDILGKWELDRGPQYLAYDFWWHLGLDTVVTSEWGTPNMVQHGINPEILLKGGYGHKLHVWDLRQAAAFAGIGSGRRVSNGAGVASRARSHARLWIPGRRGFVEGSFRLHLGLASRGRQMGREENHRDSRRASRSRKACRHCCKASRPCRR